MIGVFVITVLVFIPPLGDMQFRINIFVAWPLLSVLGVVLIVTILKKKVAGLPKVISLLTGAVAVGLPVFAVLHNLVYALFIWFFRNDFWGAMDDEPVYLILASMVCLPAFLVRTVGSIVLGVKSKSPTVSTGMP